VPAQEGDHEGSPLHIEMIRNSALNLNNRISKLA